MTAWQSGCAISLIWPSLTEKGLACSSRLAAGATSLHSEPQSLRGVRECLIADRGPAIAANAERIMRSSIFAVQRGISKSAHQAYNSLESTR